MRRLIIFLLQLRALRKNSDRRGGDKILQNFVGRSHGNMLIVGEKVVVKGSLGR
jgi:hypothetical protein